MLQKKICLLGAFGVGKTSLIHRYVHGIFSEVYQTTIGVKIDKKVVKSAGGDVLLIVWDIYGKDEFQDVQTSYLRGASGLMFIVDGTRGYTLDIALDLRKTAMQTVPAASSLLIVNKTDLLHDWEVDERKLTSLELEGVPVIRTSAKTGEGVEEAFIKLIVEMTGPA